MKLAVGGLFDGCDTVTPVETRSTPIWLWMSTGRTRTVYVPDAMAGVV